MVQLFNRSTVQPFNRSTVLTGQLFNRSPVLNRSTVLNRSIVLSRSVVRQPPEPMLTTRRKEDICEGD
jgi:hypothetical protein